MKGVWGDNLSWRQKRRQESAGLDDILTPPGGLQQALQMSFLLTFSSRMHPLNDIPPYTEGRGGLTQQAH